MNIQTEAADRAALAEGVFIIGRLERRIVCQDKTLRCVDLIDNPELEEIDLKACKTPLHLTVRGCPKLARVFLPEAGAPAVIHWDFGAGSDPVVIHGMLGQFDSCQDDTTTTRVVSEAAPFTCTLLLPEAADRPNFSHEIDAELFICLSENLPDGLALFGPDSSLRLAVLNGVDLPTDVVIGANRLHSLTLVGATKITSVSVAVPLGLLEIESCPKITRIAASGGRLRVAGGHADEIRVEGAWASGQFTDTSSRLGLSLIDHLSATGCRHIQPDHLMLENATHPLGVLPDPDCLHDPKWRSLLLGFVHHTSNSTSILPALKLLSLLMQSGLTAEETWIARNRLYANLGRSASAMRGEFPWIWQTPRDLAAEVYEVDLALWMDCLEQSPSARSFNLREQALRRTIQMASMLRVARRKEGLVQAELVTTVKASIEGIVIGRTWINGNEESATQMSQSIARMVEALVLLREHEAARTALGHLPDLILRLMHPASQLAPLSALASLGLVQAKVELMARSRSLARSNAGLAAQFHAAALQPAKTQLLSQIQTKEIALAV